MLTSNETKKYETTLYYALILQLAVISVSIAAASLSLAFSIVLVIVWLLREKKWIIPRTKLDIFFLLYFVIQCITTINAVHKYDAFINSKRLFLISLVYMPLLVFTTKEKIMKLIFILSCIFALLSISEVYLYYYTHSDRLNVFQHYMTTGGLKMIMCLMLIPFIFSTELPKKQKIFLMVFFVIIFIALILTNTRSSWLGFIAGIIVLGILYYRKLFFMLAAFIAFFFFIAPPQQIDRAKSIVDMTHPNNIGRLHMWSTGLKISNDYRWLGVGDTDLHEFYVKYKSETDTEVGGHLHNNFMTLLVIYGLLGLSVVLLLFGKIFLVEYQIFKKYKNDIFIRNVVLGSIAVFSGFLVNGMFEWNFGDHEIMVFVWGSVGLALSSERIGDGARV
jgi:O-antigen ligase